MNCSSVFFYINIILHPSVFIESSLNPELKYKTDFANPSHPLTVAEEHVCRAAWYTNHILSNIIRIYKEEWRSEAWRPFRVISPRTGRYMCGAQNWYGEFDKKPNESIKTLTCIKEQRRSM